MEANHQDAKILIKGRLVDLKRGDQARSEVTLSDAWGWSRDKVRRFLKLLEKDQMIRQQKSNLTSVISICNYNTYQSSTTADDTADDTAKKHQKDSRQDTDNNVNNENNGNKKPIAPKPVKRFVKPTPEELGEHFRSKGSDGSEAENFFNHYESNGWKVGKNPMKNWKAAVANWLKRKNGGTYENGQRPTTQSRGPMSAVERVAAANGLNLDGTPINPGLDQGAVVKNGIDIWSQVD